jgi:hypothetical protein
MNLLLISDEPLGTVSTGIYSIEVNNRSRRVLASNINPTNIIEQSFLQMRLLAWKAKITAAIPA